VAARICLSGPTFHRFGGVHLISPAEFDSPPWAGSATGDEGDAGDEGAEPCATAVVETGVFAADGATVGEVDAVRLDSTSCGAEEQPDKLATVKSRTANK